MARTSLLRSGTAVAAAVVMGLAAAFPAFAASAGDSLVPVGSLDGTWAVTDRTSTTDNGSNNASETFVRADGVVVQLNLVGLNSASDAQTVQQYYIDQARAGMPSGFAILPTQLYGDANAYSIAGSADGKTAQGYLFVDKSVVVYILTIGPDSLADDVRSVSDKVATAQDAILPSNA